MSPATAKPADTAAGATTPRLTAGARSTVLRPRQSEKTYALAQANNVYVFAVPAAANKHAVKRAVEAQFGVSVESVNVLNQRGKAKRTVRKRARPIAGRQSDTRKAYVTLKAGDTIPVFAAIEKAEAEAKQAEAKSAPKADRSVKASAGKAEKSVDKSVGAVEPGRRRLFRRLTK